MTERSRAERTLAMADHLRELFGAHDVDVAVIGAMALAAYGYPRSTRDVCRRFQLEDALDALLD